MLNTDQNYNKTSNKSCKTLHNCQLLQSALACCCNLQLAANDGKF